MTNSLPQRKHPVHGIEFVQDRSVIVFGTVCTKNRQPWLASVEIHELLKEIWQTATAWVVGRYVILPDHIHFFAGETETTIPYDNWVRYWKSQFSKRHGNKIHRWQTDHWDTRMRDENVYEEKWEYARWNPVRHRLIEKPGDWPFQGQIHELRWN